VDGAKELSATAQRSAPSSRILDFVALLIGTAAVVAMIRGFLTFTDGAGGGTVLMLIGFPVIIAAILLAIRYRRDVRHHWRQILAGCGAGAAALCFVSLNDRLAIHERVFGPHRSWNSFLLEVVIWLLMVILAGPLMSFLYRHSLSALRPLSKTSSDVGLVD